MHKERIVAWCAPCVNIHYSNEVTRKRVAPTAIGYEYTPNYVDVSSSGVCRVMVCKRTGWEIPVEDYFSPPLEVEVPDEGDPIQLDLFDDEEEDPLC